MLGRWPHLEALARARVSSITEVVAAHTRGVADVEQRAQKIRSTARAWAEFWDGHLDLDALGWETTELLADLTAADARVDRATANTVLATVALPVDVGGPAVLPDSVFFPGYGGSTAVVVDRATWTVSATPDLGVAGGGSGQPAFDGDSIYVSTSDHRDVLRVDSTTFTVTDTIEPLGVNAIIVDDGALSAARGQPIDSVQRFDIDQGR